MITAATKLEHAHRLLRTVPLDRLKVLRQIAKREGRWPHVDWDRIDDPTPPPPALCRGCGKPVPMSGQVCIPCRKCAWARAERREVAAETTSAKPVTEQPKLTPERICPDCGKNPLGCRQRVCEPCRTKRRRKTYRDQRRRQRNRRGAAVPQLT